MVWLNHEHQNIAGPPRGFGGAMCVCSKCQKERVLENAVNHIECLVQVNKTVDELITLSGMLDSPYKKEKLCEAAAMLKDWAKNIEVKI